MEDASIDGLGQEIDRAHQLADSYSSPAYGGPGGEILQKRAARVIGARQRIHNPLVHRDFTEDELAMAEALGGVESLGSVAGQSIAETTVLHAGNPGIEYAVRYITDEIGNSVSTVRVAVMRILGILDTARATLNEKGPGPGVRAGNRHCDWRNHGGSYENTLTVLDMSVLVIPRGNRIIAWVCCPRCRQKLDRQYTLGLRWLPR